MRTSGVPRPSRVSRMTEVREASGPAAGVTEDSDAVALLGATVRAARKQLDLSVQALAQSAGVSLGLVSQLERGLGNPSLHTIHRIAAALGMSVTRLLEPPVEELVVVRADRPHVLPPAAGTPDDGQAVRELLSPRGETAIQLIRTTLPPTFTNEARPFRHLGTETVTVLSGRLHITHGDRHIDLGPGDTATYGCSTPHWWANGHDGETVVLGAVAPSER